MTDQEVTGTPQPRELQLRTARATIAHVLGPDKLARLHAPNRALDILAIVGAPLLFVACAWWLATSTIRDPLWWLCLLLQGDLVLVMAFINHDAFVHRKLFAPRVRWVLGSILVWPSQLRGAIYEVQHLTHHRALGTEGDTELYKAEIDTPLKRIAYATPFLMVYRILVLGNKTSSVNVSGRQQVVKQRDASRDRWEKGTRLAIFAAAFASLFWHWQFVVFGYLLPFVLVTPLLNTMRIVLEHFDLHRDNPLWVGTFYRTGPISRLAFWWDAGDCHLVHHFYANIPYYRMGEALRVMRPILADAGVLEQRSLGSLMREWFSGARPHWSVPRA